MNAQQRRKLRRQERRAATGTPPALPMGDAFDHLASTAYDRGLTPLTRQTPTVEEERLELAVRPRTGLAIAAGIGVGAALVGGIWAALAVML